MRSVIAYFIKFPVAVNVVMFGILIFGVLGVSQMKSSFFPLTESRIITISITYPGASPQEIEEGIVLQIEDNLKGLVGIDRVTSTSKENSGTITVEIEKGEDINDLLAEVKNAVDRVPSYPVDMEPLVVAKQESIRETITFSLSGENVPLKTLKQISQSIENDLRTMEGISQVSISGYPDEEIEIAVRESDLQAYDLSFQDVANTVARENILTTGGNIKTDTEEYLIRANNRSYYADQLNNLIVRTDITGKTVRIKDVADVRDTFSETPNASYFNGNLAVNITVSNTNNEDLISSAAKINEYIETFNQKYNNVRLDVESDSSVTLNQRTQLLSENMAIGVFLVLFFLSFFLNTRIAFWVAVGFPVSFAGMFIFAPGLDVTINVLSLFGMIIVIGILVDDGIVISENIYHHYEKGKDRIQAAIDGTMEVVAPIVSAIITTVLAFSTFLFLDGRIGDNFSEVSVVIMLTLAVSLFEAFVILPAHIAHSKALDKQKPKKGLFAFFRKFNVIGNRIVGILRDNTYTPILKFMMNNKFIGMSIVLAMFILTIGAVGGGIIRTSFFPSIASDRVSITLTMPEGTSVSITDSLASYIETRIWEVNEEYTAKQSDNQQVVQNVIKKIGPGTANASLVVNLLPGESRDFGSFLIANSIEEKVGPIYGAESITFGSGGNFGGSPVAVSLLSNNIEELKLAKEELKEELKRNPLLKDVSDNDPAGIKEISIQLKENAYLVGLDYSTVMGQVRSGFFGNQAQRFQRGEDEIKVWVRYQRENRASLMDLDKMRIVTPSGERVPFSEIATYSIERGEVAINHLDGQREIQVVADMKNPDESATDINSDIKARILPEIQSKYPSISASYEGQNREANKFSDSAGKVFPVIILLIYATIAFTFRSYSQPLLLMLLVPLSLVGVAWGHWIHGFPVNILSLLGIIALIGILVNDGLVLIEKFNGNMRQGMRFDEALLEAGRSRFRAIFLTTLTTVAGLAPLMLETSRQAQFLKPMAISISYGMAFATILTLVVLPIILSFSNSIKVGIKWLRTGDDITKEEVERSVIEINEH
ncbi:MAG: efflux RND transporter permease subunit [Cyclobacteriaceae bacterium]